MKRTHHNDTLSPRMKNPWSVRWQASDQTEGMYLPGQKQESLRIVSRKKPKNDGEFNIHVFRELLSVYNTGGVPKQHSGNPLGERTAIPLIFASAIVPITFLVLNFRPYHGRLTKRT
jgi:hypothetical protein